MNWEKEMLSSLEAKGRDNWTAQDKAEYDYLTLVRPNLNIKRR